MLHSQFLSAVEITTVFIVSVLFFYYLYYQYCFTHWKKKGVPSLTPSFPAGDLSFSVLGVESIYVRIQKLYNAFKSRGDEFGGIYYFNGPVFFPVHPEIIKKVLVTDFDHFVDRGMYISDKVPLSNHMFSMNGERWKNLRAKFSPTFTSGKMKSMYNILLKNFENLVHTLEPLDGQVIDIKELLMRVTVDIIGSASFGIDCNSLKYPETEFARMVNKIFSPPKWKLLKLFFEEGLKNPGNILKIAHDDENLERYFTSIVQQTVDYRDDNHVERDDFLNILMKLREGGMSVSEITAQSFLFFTAGYETSSSTMSNCIHELTYNQELQDQLRGEIHEKLGRDSTKYAYEDVMALPLLDRMIKETLRKYPPVPLLNRICVKPYKIPGTEAVIDVGTPVIISTLGLHRDPEFFADPMKFDPDRFSNDNKIQPFTYLPFGDGPRNCIGLRFGLMQTKLGLVSMINEYRFLPSEKSPRHLNISPSTTVLVLTMMGGIYVRIAKI